MAKIPRTSPRYHPDAASLIENHKEELEALIRNHALAKVTLHYYENGKDADSEDSKESHYLVFRYWREACEFCKILDNYYAKVASRLTSDPEGQTLVLYNKQAYTKYDDAAIARFVGEMAERHHIPAFDGGRQVESIARFKNFRARIHREYQPGTIVSEILQHAGMPLDALNRQESPAR